MSSVIRETMLVPSDGRVGILLSETRKSGNIGEETLERYQGQISGD